MAQAPVMRQSDATPEGRSMVDFSTRPDDEAFERVVARYGPMVHRACREILGDHAAADDAFQATFLVLFRRAGSIRHPDALGRWLYEVACRVARRSQAGERRRRSRERQGPTMAAAAAPDRELSDREWPPILHEEIGRLPAKLRDAIVLCYFEGLTVEAAARRLACPTGTLKSRLVKGREQLRSRLARRGLAATAVLLLLLLLEGPADAAVPSGPLIRATARGILGGPGATSGRVEAMARDAEGPGRLGKSRLWAVLVLLLATCGGVRWSLGASPTPAPVATGLAAWRAIATGPWGFGWHEGHPQAASCKVH